MPMLWLMLAFGLALAAAFLVLGRRRRGSPL
jgi:LPXTG-motif cell wall-anchored protein